MEKERDIDLNRSLRNLLMDGIASQIMFSLVTVSIVSSYLASVNADPFIIGLVAAIPFLSQLIQLPSAIFAEKYSRKKISLLTNFVSRFSLLLIGVTLLISGSSILSFIILFATYHLFKETSAVAWSSWMRDLIPAHVRGEFYSKRVAYGKLVALFVVLVFTFIFNFLRDVAFSLVFIVAFAAGMTSLYFIRGIDDIEVERKGNRNLKEPLKNSNFLKLTLALSIWKFASEMALPFFSVYIIAILKYPVWVVIALTSVSQLSSTYFLRISGRIMDKFGNKPVAILSFISFSIAAFIFTFTTMPGKHPLTPLLLIVIYVLDGFYSAVPGIAFMNMIAKITHRGSSASYYAINNVMASMFAAVGSISGGFIASAFLSANFAVKIDIESSLGFIEIPAVHLAGYDFLFIISALISLMAAKLLRFFGEDGESSEEVVKEEIKHAVLYDVQTIMTHMHLLKLFNLDKPHAVNTPLHPSLSSFESPLQPEKGLEESIKELT
ncbi:MFS transporter [Archaeoglobus veneficus]|uniref:Major facilitator superfamily MFS_1 n=1 Tax=Archaeoglobus veneficus (strain DSM 11195 / SNP6) TaxID=693661 RepID=F2KMH3_ARCVS|nr:MFS transporter [Archaeoglobus veneficus]AEA47170.1 major facilitator superfamily MFS_1 [Archaeoglobus veneficus SNP6]